MLLFCLFGRKSHFLWRWLFYYVVLAELALHLIANQRSSFIRFIGSSPIYYAHAVLAQLVQHWSWKPVFRKDIGVRFSTLPLFHLSYDKNGNKFAVWLAFLSSCRQPFSMWLLRSLQSHTAFAHKYVCKRNRLFGE